MFKKELLAALDADRDVHISFLQIFLQAKSPNPPGDTREAAHVVYSYLQSHHVPTEVSALKESMPNIVSDFTGGLAASGGPRLIMNGHMDVFPVNDAPQWTHDPWSGDISPGNSRIYGRGAVDMKAGTAASIIAYAYLHARREHLHGSVALTIVSDEETGGKYGSRWLLQNPSQGSRFRGDVMINAEPGGLSSIRFGEKGTLRLTFTVQTPGANGAYLNLGEGANRVAARLIEELVRKIESLDSSDMPDSLRRHLMRPEVRSTIDEIMGPGACDLMNKPTVNVGTIHGGVKVNMIPSSCVVEADIRLPIGMDRRQVMSCIQDEILQGFPQVKVQVQEAASNPPNYCKEDHPMVEMMQRNAQSAAGRLPIAIPGLGGTDCKFWRYDGVPAYVFGVSPKGMAAVDESVLIEEFLAVVKTHAASAWDYLGGSP